MSSLRRFLGFSFYLRGGTNTHRCCNCHFVKMVLAAASDPSQTVGARPASSWSGAYFTVQKRMGPGFPVTMYCSQPFYVVWREDTDKEILPPKASAPSWPPFLPCIFLCLLLYTYASRILEKLSPAQLCKIRTSPFRHNANQAFKDPEVQACIEFMKTSELDMLALVRQLSALHILKNWTWESRSGSGTQLLDELGLGRGLHFSSRHCMPGDRYWAKEFETLGLCCRLSRLMGRGCPEHGKAIWHWLWRSYTLTHRKNKIRNKTNTAKRNIESGVVFPTETSQMGKGRFSLVDRMFSV